MPESRIAEEKKETDFLRYEEKGAYHWALNSRHPLRGNAFVRARYENVAGLAEKSLPGGLGGKTVLDHGCGDGVLSRILARKGARVLGLDNSETALRYGMKRAGGTSAGGPRVHFQSGSAYDLPYRDESFDCALSTQVIEHLAEPERMLGEIRRVLKPGARGVITTRIRLTEKPIDPTHVAEWFEDEFRERIEVLFPGAEYFRSHPAAWMEASHRHKTAKVFANLLSLAGRNPFSGFESGYRLMVIQYALIAR